MARQFTILSAICTFLLLGSAAAKEYDSTLAVRPVKQGDPRVAGTVLASNVSSRFLLGPAQTTTLYVGDFGYSISVPSGATRMEVSLSCNTEVDLFVRYGQDVGLSGGQPAADFRSELDGGDEFVAISGSSLQQGIYYIGFGLYSLGSLTDCTVKATYLSTIPSNALVGAQFVSGSGWDTAVFVNNYSTVTETFTIKVFGDNGKPMQVPFLLNGTTDTITGSLKPGETQVFETKDTSLNLSQGWVAVLPGTANSQRLSGFAIFRNRQAGRADNEAVVGLTNVVDRKYTLLFDNALGFETGAAFVNPSPLDTVVMQATIKDAAGTTVGTNNFTLPPMGHLALVMSQSMAASAGKRGSVLLTITGPSVNVLGLRFSPAGPFTSFPATPIP